LAATATSASDASRLARGYLICIIGTVVWSAVAVFVRYLTIHYGMPPLVLAFWRDMLLALVLLLAFGTANQARLHVDRRHWKFLLIYGLILSLFNSLWTISVAMNGAAVSTVLAYSSAAFTAVLGWRLFGEQLGPTKIVAVTLSLVGCAFVSGAYNLAAWQLNPLGVFTGISSGIAFAAYSLMGKAASERRIYPWTTVLYTFGIASIFLLAYNLLPLRLPQGLASTNLLWLGSAWMGWIMLGLLVLGPTLGGYGLYTVSMTYLPASVANLIATMEPVFTSIQSFLLLGERFTVPQWIGSLLIIGGVVVLRLTEGK
jgi:drug/metabolite transporter (DMT)-like permease